MDEYIFRKQYGETNNLDDIRMGEHEILIYNKKQRAYVKWKEEGLDGVRVWKKGKGMEAKPWRTSAVCKSLQQQTGVWMQRFKVKCFRLKREQWGKNKLTRMSTKTLTAIVVVEAQVPHKVTYVEKSTTRRGSARYKTVYEFQKGMAENIREKIAIFFFRHMTQNAINLEEENGPDIEYSEYKIRHFPRRVEIKFLKYGELHPMDLGQEGDRDEEVGEDGG